MSQFNLVSPPVPMAGELASLGAALIWSCSLSIFSVFGRQVPAAALNLFKNLVAIVCLGCTALVLRPPRPDHWMDYLVLAASGIVGLSLGDTALFAALKRLGAQVTSASQCLAPPIAALIAIFFMNETLSLRELLGLLLTAGAVGALIYFGQRGGAPLASIPKKTLVTGLFFALCGALCQGLGIVLQRIALQNVHVISGTIIRVAPAILVLVAMNVLRPVPVSMGAIFVSRKQAMVLTLAAFAGTFVGLILMSLGAKYTKAGIAAALTSTYPLWIIPIARFILKERVSWQSSACTLVAVSGIILMVL